MTDNPILLSAKETISGGNFHGQPLALPLDYAALAAAELGNISDRRIYLSLEGKVAGLPQLLMKNTGINSGFMLPQYTSAALVSEKQKPGIPGKCRQHSYFPGPGRPREHGLYQWQKGPAHHHQPGAGSGD